MAIYLFLEDTKGGPTFQVLARRITQRSTKRILLKGGEILNESSVASHIRAEQPLPADRIVAIADKDCNSERRKQLDAIQGRISRTFSTLSFRYIMAVEEVESWLAVDNGAIERVLKRRGITERLPAGECEDPKIWLKKIYKKYSNRPYVPAIENPKLAAEIDLGLVAAANESFGKFRASFDD